MPLVCDRSASTLAAYVLFPVLVALPAARASADLASATIAQVTIGDVTATSDHTETQKLCPDGVTLIVDESVVEDKIDLPSAAFDLGAVGSPLTQDVSASFGRNSATVKAGTTKAKTDAAFQWKPKFATKMGLADTTFRVTWNGDPEQTAAMQEHVRVPEACPDGEKGHDVPAGGSSEYESQLGTDDEPLMLLRTLYENLDGLTARYTYTIENPSSEPIHVHWQSVATTVTPGGWEVELLPGQVASLELLGPIEDTFVIDDDSVRIFDEPVKLSVGPAGEIEGTYVAPTILPGPPVLPEVPVMSPWARGALVLLLSGVAWLAAAWHRERTGLVRGRG